MHGRIVNIFFAYTGDSVELLNRAKKQVELFNNSMGGRILFHIREWKTYVKSEMGRPEDVILRQMPIPASHLFVGVFRFRCGVPTGNVNPETGKKYCSGMEEEFSIAYRMWKEHRKPRMMIFRSTEPIPQEEAKDARQLEALESFFKEFSADGSHPGLYTVFDSAESFSASFTGSLLSYSMELMQEDTILRGGLTNVFFDTDSAWRNSVKQDVLRASSTFRLQANTGYSFLAPRGVHNSLFRQGLERGMTARVVLLNPWSVAALFSLLRITDFPKKSDYSRYLRGELPADQLLELYMKSHGMPERLNHCIESYEELRREFGSRIELRLSDRDMSDSILLMDQSVFYEPYFSVLEKDKKAIAAFELQASTGSALYQDTSAYFERLWDSSCKCRFYRRNQAFFAERLRIYLEKGWPAGGGRR